MKMTVLFLSLAVAAFGQYKLESAGAPPADLAPPIQQALQKDGHKIVAPNGSVFCEVWFRATAPAGGKTAEEAVSLTSIPHGSLLGVIRFPGRGADRRGQAIKPGVYTLRLSYYPVDGAHQGVAPQRDFLLMIPASEDKDLNATPKFDEVVAMSRKAAGTAHPAILSAWKAEGAGAPELKQEGEMGDWVIYTKVGDTPIAVILVGTHQG